MTQVTKYLFDINQVASEVYAYLTTFTIHRDEIKEKTLFINDLEGLIVRAIRIQIELNTHIYIRKLNTSIDIYQEFSNTHGLNQIDLEDVLDGLMSVQGVITYINSLMGDDTFNVWIIDKQHGLYVFENLGDYRIEEWTREHIKSGRYVR
jgi:hypothetical protein